MPHYRWLGQTWYSPFGKDDDDSDGEHEGYRKPPKDNKAVTSETRYDGRKLRRERRIAELKRQDPDFTEPDYVYDDDLGDE